MVSIPSGIYSKYVEFADAMLDNTTGFGIQCKFVFINKIESISTNLSNVYQKKVMNPQLNSQQGAFARGDEDFKTTEITEDVVFRVYWNKKDFKRFGNITVPDGSIMTIGRYSDIQNINKCAFLSIYHDKTNHEEWRFTKLGEPTVHGLNNNYVMCYWARA